MNKFRVLAVILVILVMCALCSFQVAESQIAIVERLGQLKKRSQAVAVYGPGLHFKWPIETPILMDRRLQGFEVPSSRVLTEEQKSVNVDYYVKWRMVDPALFYTRTSLHLERTQGMILKKVNDLLRARFGDCRLIEVISGRQQTMLEITKNANLSTQDIGVEVVDVRIVSIDYPQQVSESVYQRMITEREQAARTYRAMGRMQAAEIEAKADREAAVLEAEAAFEGAKTRAAGDREAAEIANQTYGAFASFYHFWKKLDIYRASFKHHSMFFLNPAQQEDLNALFSETNS